MLSSVQVAAAAAAVAVVLTYRSAEVRQQPFLCWTQPTLSTTGLKDLFVGQSAE